MNRFDFCCHGFVLGILAGACLIKTSNDWPAINVPALLFGICAFSYFIFLAYKAYVDDKDDEA